LRTLEERKAVAIQNEDYDSASIIKQEIEKLRNAVAPDSMLRRPESA
jgi:centrosomal protein CEP104